MKYLFLPLIVLFLSGCATAPQYPGFSVAALAPYKKIMLARIKNDEMLFVTYRYWRQPSGPNLIGNFIDEGYSAYVAQTNKSFNDKIKRNMKPELETRLYGALEDGLKTRQIKYVSVGIAAKDVDMNLYNEESRAKLAALLRDKCASCDAALVIDPAFGYVKHGNGLRACSGGNMVLISLADGTIRAKSSPYFVDTTSKYDYAFESEVLKDAIRAAEFIPPTVDSLAKVILAEVTPAVR
jgi:hypothetical protein